MVFDELEKSQSHLLIDQMHRYFADTMVGQQRSSRIIPEPFFVHSDLTTGVQIADLVAYVISWGFRMARMTKPARPELSQLSNQVAGLRHRAIRKRLGNPEFEIWSSLMSPTCGRRPSAMRWRHETQKKAMKRRTASKPPRRY